MGRLKNRVGRIERRVQSSVADKLADYPEPATAAEATELLRALIAEVKDRERRGEPFPDPPAEDSPVTLELRELLARSLAEAEKRQPSE